MGSEVGCLLALDRITDEGPLKKYMRLYENECNTTYMVTDHGLVKRRPSPSSSYIFFIPPHHILTSSHLRI